MRRFYIEETQKKSENIILEGSEARHILKVLRLGVGARVALFDKKGTEYTARITDASKNRVVLGINRVTPCTGGRKIVLVQGVLKSDKMDVVVQKTTELGVSDIIVFFSERSVPVWNDEKIEAKKAHWQRIVIESIKQSGGIRRLPEVRVIRCLTDVVQQPFEGFLKMMLWEGETRTGVRQVLKSGRNRDIICLIGPEGGFSEHETDLAKKAGFITAGMGQSILRAETAAIAAITVIGYEGGTLGQARDKNS